MDGIHKSQSLRKTVSGTLLFNSVAPGIYAQSHGLLDAAYASGGHVSGYVYSSSDVTAETYCVHADRINDKCGRRDFIVCEDGSIRYAESKVRGTVKRDEGSIMSEGPRAGPHGQFQK